MKAITQHAYGDADRPLTNRRIRRASVIAGISLLLMAALAGFGYLVAVEGLVTYDDANENAASILESSGLFRAGIFSLFIVIALDVVVAWALYHVFAPVNRTLSAVAAWIRGTYAAIFAAAVAQLVGVLLLLTSAGTGEPHPRNAEALAGVNTFAAIYDAGLLFFGLHLLVIGWMSVKADYVPTWLGALVLVAGSGYIVDSLGTFLSRGSWTDVSTFTFVGEFLLAVWLVMWGRRITFGQGVEREGSERGNSRAEVARARP
jgi:hypothetical protein